MFEGHHQQGAGIKHVVSARVIMEILVSSLAPDNAWAEAIVIGFEATYGDGSFAGLRLRGKTVGPK